MRHSPHRSLARALSAHRPGRQVPQVGTGVQVDTGGSGGQCQKCCCCRALPLWTRYLWPPPWAQPRVQPHQRLIKEEQLIRCQYRVCLLCETPWVHTQCRRLFVLLLCSVHDALGFLLGWASVVYSAAPETHQRRAVDPLPIQGLFAVRNALGSYTIPTSVCVLESKRAAFMCRTPASQNTHHTVL
jgi:hypothetical protein